jgi:hypothetical protein
MLEREKKGEVGRRPNKVRERKISLLHYREREREEWVLGGIDVAKIYHLDRSHK